MRLFITPQLIGLFALLTLPLPIATVTPLPCEAAVKSKKTKQQSKVPIDTVGQQATKPLELEGIKENLEGRMNVIWRPLSNGKSTFCEVHFWLLNSGHYSDPIIWRSSGSKNFDQMCKIVADQAGPFGPFEGVDKLEVIATFKTEALGADVVVRFPGYQGVNSNVDKEIAAKRTQNLATIKIMKDRIVSAQKVLGSDSPKLSQSINFLGNTYKDVGDYASAEAAFKWAIAIREKANGPNSKELAESLSDLGEMYRAKGDMVSAEDCFKRVLSMSALKPCVELRTAIHRYAKLCLYTKRKSDSDFLFQRVIDLQAGHPLAPLPANLTIEPSTSADAAAKEGTAADTKSADKSTDGKGGDKPTATGAKAAETTSPDQSKSTDKAANTTTKADDQGPAADRSKSAPDSK